MLVSINQEEFGTIIEALALATSHHQRYREDFEKQHNSTSAKIEQSHMEKEYKMIDKLYKEQAKQG